MTSIIEERGFFWWSLREPRIGPTLPSRSSGRLKVNEDGFSVLELDGELATDPNTRLLIDANGIVDDLVIIGQFIRKSQYVVLNKISRYGFHISSNSGANESFTAEQCCISEYGGQPFIDGPPSVSSIHYSLDCIRDWFRPGEILIAANKDEITAKASAPDKIQYKLSDAALTLHSWMEQSDAIRATELTITQRYELEFTPAAPCTMTKMAREVISFSDLIKLLLDTEYDIPRPSIMLSGLQSRFTFYSYLKKSDAMPPKFHEQATLFGELRSDFGRIVESWRSGLEAYGQGFYLYLGTRRGLSLYSEHKFINFMWQVESLHRSKFGDVKDPKLTEKIARICSQVDKNRDRKWLASRLSNADEPNLKSRMLELFFPVASFFNVERLDVFFGKCVDRRNDMSHYGGARNPSMSTEFIQEINILSAGLSVLIHARLLLEIGVSLPIVERWIFKGWSSVRNKQYLIRAEILDKDALQREIDEAIRLHRQAALNSTGGS